MTISEVFKRELLSSYRTILAMRVTEHERVEKTDQLAMAKVDKLLSAIAEICQGAEEIP